MLKKMMMLAAMALALSVTVGAATTASQPPPGCFPCDEGGGN